MLGTALDALKGLNIHNHHSHSHKCISNDVKKIVGD